MSELMIDLICSLDGWAAADGWPGLWGMGGPDYLSWLDESDTGHVTLMGANTYRLMSSIAADPGADDGVTALTSRPKVVFSSSLREPLDWDNTEIVTGDAVAAVRERKRTETRPLHTLGSLALGRSLLTAGLVDRLRLVVFPVINGQSGRDRIFVDYPEVRLDLVENRTFDGNLQLLEYAPTVLDGPPGAGG